MFFVVEAWLVVATMAWAWRSAREERLSDLGLPRGRGRRGQPTFWSPSAVGATASLLSLLAVVLLVGNAQLVGGGSDSYSELDQLAILGVPIAVFALVLLSGSFWALIVAMASELHRHQPSRATSRFVVNAPVVGRVVIASAVAVGLGLAGVLLQVNVDARAKLASEEIDASFGVPWVDGDDSYRNHPVRPLPAWTQLENSSTPFAATGSLVPTSEGASRWLLGFQMFVLLGIAWAAARLVVARPLDLALRFASATVFGATIGAVTAAAVVRTGIASYNGGARLGRPEVPFEMNWWWTIGTVATSAVAVGLLAVVSSSLRKLRPTTSDADADAGTDAGTVSDTSEPQLVMPPRPTRPRANSISPM